MDSVDSGVWSAFFQFKTKTDAKKVFETKKNVSEKISPKKTVSFDDDGYSMEFRKTKQQKLDMGELNKDWKWIVNQYFMFSENSLRPFQSSSYRYIFFVVFLSNKNFEIKVNFYLFVCLSNHES